MDMTSINNPRFPHSGIVYRMVGEDSFTDGERLVLYEGKCRKYVTKGMRTGNSTTSSQYTLAIPGTVQARIGDRVEVDDRTGHFEGTVTEVNAGNFGTDIYWNHDNR